jgi:hypothetical protein
MVLTVLLSGNSLLMSFLPSSKGLLLVLLFTEGLPPRMVLTCIARIESIHEPHVNKHTPLSTLQQHAIKR